MCKQVISLRDTRCLVMLLSLLICPYVVRGEPAADTVAGAYEVAANDVYVRSGGSLNHYTICKLNAGDQVTVTGEKNGWYEILSPDGTFSLISGDYVDTADDKTGVVNGENVRVRAGSQLNTNKYTVQRLLSKGEEVTILGRNADGFLRIVPPEGATLWISREFLVPVPSGAVARRVDVTPMSQLSNSHSSAAAGNEAGALSSSELAMGPRESTSDYGAMLAALPPTQERQALEEIDDDVAVELSKPLLNRRFEVLLRRYQTLASQDNDPFAKRYAQTRIEQLQTIDEIASTVRKVRALGEQTDVRRGEFLAERTMHHQAEIPAPSGIDARGELRVSALYPEGRLPRRYRLVDTSTPGERTVAYVDIPSDTGLDVNAYLGKYVGVRARQKRLLAGGVDPIPVFLARELFPLDLALEGTKKNTQD